MVFFFFCFLFFFFTILSLFLIYNCYCQNALFLNALKQLLTVTLVRKYYLKNIFLLLLFFLFFSDF